LSKMAKRLLGFVIVLAVCAGMIRIPVYAAGGYINDGDIKWTYQDGVLTISGTGEMPDYGTITFPWKKYAYEAEKIIINDGITRVGSSSFVRFTALTEIRLPETLTSIGSGAFQACSALKKVTIPDSVETIEYLAFNATGLEELSLNLETIPRMTFDETPLTSLVLGSNVRTVEAEAFGNTALRTVTIPATVTSIGDHAFGYEIVDDEGYEEGGSGWIYTKVRDFRMTVYAGSAGEDYAVSNGFDHTVVGSPEFIVQPKSVSAKAGDPVRFAVKVNNASSYQWWVWDTNKWDKAGSYQGCKTRAVTFTADAGMDGWKFLCKVKGTDGTYLKSDCVTLTILKPAGILVQPKPVSTAAGTKVRFAVKAENVAAYRWQYYDGSGWKNLSSSFTGYNTRELTLKALAARNGWKLRCRVKGRDGVWIVSNSVKLTVK